MPFLSATFEDDWGRTTKRLIEIETEVDLAGYLAQAAAFADEIEPITDLGLVRLDIILNTTESFDVTADSNVDTGATFVGRTDHVPPHKATHKVAGFKPSLVDADGTINLEGESVAAYLVMFTESGGDFLISDGEHIVQWLKGVMDR